MAKLWRKPNSSEPAAPGAVETDLSALRIDRPALIFLNGFFVMDKNIEWAAASLRTMEDMLANRPAGGPETDVYSWTHAGLKEVFNVTAYCARPDSRSCRAVTKLATGLIMPLVAKDFAVDAKGKATGTPLPLEEAKKNLRNITFFGYSAGSITAQECFNASLKMMKQIGYRETDARAALHEVVYIGVGVVSRPEREKNRFTTLFLEARNDKIIRFKDRLWKPLHALFSHFAHPLKIKPMGRFAARISATIPNRKWEIRVRDGETVRERVKSLLPSFLAAIKTYHELPRYVTQDEKLSPFAKMVQYAITNGVARQERLAPLRLLEPPPGTDDAIAAAYREKIAAAYVKPGQQHQLGRN